MYCDHRKRHRLLESLINFSRINFATSLTRAPLSRSLIQFADVNCRVVARNSRRSSFFETRDWFRVTFQADTPPGSGWLEGGRESCIVAEGEAASREVLSTPLPKTTPTFHPLLLVSPPPLPSSYEAYRKTHKSKLHLRSPMPTQKCNSRINIRPYSRSNLSPLIAATHNRRNNSRIYATAFYPRFQWRVL